MTAQQLYESWLTTPYEDLEKHQTVDAETFASVCNAIFQHKMKDPNTVSNWCSISLGVNGGIYFHGIEIILK